MLLGREKSPFVKLDQVICRRDPDSCAFLAALAESRRRCLNGDGGTLFSASQVTGSLERDRTNESARIRQDNESG